MQLDQDKNSLPQSEFSFDIHIDSKKDSSDQFFSSKHIETSDFQDKELDVSTVNEYILHCLDHQQTKIAQDLHDCIGQELYSLRLFVDSLEYVQSDTYEFSKTLNCVQTMIETTMQTVRSLSKNLNPLFASENNLIQSITLFIDQINQIRPKQIEFNYSSSSIVFHDESHLIHVYRIIQEFITNSLKYANAQKIILDLNCLETDKLEISIRDNGIGFNLNKSRNTCGITNIYNRLKALDAQVDFASAIGFGTQLTFILDGKCYKNSSCR